jgi:gluconate 2-dehydrogenase gamma chain
MRHEADTDSEKFSGPPLKGRIDRRQFLQTSLVAGLAMATPIWVSLSGCQSVALQKRPFRLRDEFTEADKRLLASIQEHLFPTEDDSPGANSLQAMEYLLKTFEHGGLSMSDWAFLRWGLHQISAMARDLYYQPFENLHASGRERLLRTLESSEEGSRWIGFNLQILMEALLSDPVYGGNPREIGWVWLGIQPGHPRPSVGKRYYEL